MNNKFFKRVMGVILCVVLLMAQLSASVYGATAEASIRGNGNLTISNEIVHTLGNGYQIPEAQYFIIDVKLTGEGVANTTFAAAYTDGSVSSVTTDASGCFTVELGHDEQFEIFALPAGTVATISERNPGTGFTPAYWEETVLGDGVVEIAANATASVVVVNNYEPGEVSPVNVVLYGEKVYITDAADWNGAVFEFQLQRWTAEGWKTIATATADECSPEFDFNTALGAEKYSAPGAYYYQVLETNGGQTIEGITYDATLHTFGITVSDLDMDGRLEIDKVSSYHTGREFGVNSDGNWQIDIVFHNAYNASGDNVVLDVQKMMSNESYSPMVSLSGFQFGLYEGEELFAVSEFTDGVGEARFILHYDLEDVGKHIYTLKELVPQKPITNMHYDTTTYTVEVEVADNEDGTITASIAGIDGEADYTTPVFTNVYHSSDVELNLDFVRAQITGRDLVAGEFAFQLRGVDNSTVISGSNDAEGNVIFEDKLHFDSVGTYLYELVQTGGDGKGVTVDKTVYNIFVTVGDVSGRLFARHHVLNVVQESVTFQNTYEAKPASYTVSGVITRNGEVPANEEFVFALMDADGEVVDEVGNDADGKFSFKAISFTEAKTYHYSVYENVNTGLDNGIVYDDTVYELAITVEDNLEGALEVTEVSVIGGDTNEIVFNNTNAGDVPVEDIPQTSDAGLSLWIALLAVSGGLVGLIAQSQNREEDNL